MAFQFRNTGAAITDALFNFMREKEKARREAMQARLEQEREARLGRSTDAQIENMRADTELAREQLAATLADRDVQRRTREAELAGETYDIGDDVTEDPAVPKNLRNKQRTLASRTLDMSTGVPGVIDAPMMQGRDMGTSETGREVFRGTAGQRAAAMKKAEEDTELAQWKQRMDALQKDPNTPAAVKQWAQFAEPGDTPPAGVFDTPEKDSPKVGTFEDYVVRTYGPNPTPEQIRQGRKDFLQADDRPFASRLIITPGVAPYTFDPNTNSTRGVTGQDGNPLPTTPTTEQINRDVATERSAAVLDSVAELSERINVNQGVYARAVGAAERAAAKVNLDDDVAEYEAMVNAFTPLWARALGHTGVLTEQDVVSARAALPQPGDSKTLRDRKIARITKILSSQPRLGQTSTSSGESDSAVPAPARRRRFNPATGTLE